MSGNDPLFAKNSSALFRETALASPQKEEALLRKADKGKYWLLFTCITFILAFILGLIGFNSIPDFTLPDSIYATLRMYLLNFDATPGNYPAILEIARWLAIYAAFSSLIQLAAIIFSRQIKMLKLHFYNDHYIILGFNLYTKHLALDLLQKGNKVVIIDKSPNIKYAGIIKQFKGIILKGNPLDAYILRQAKLKKASCIVIFTEKDQTNIELHLEVMSIMNSSLTDKSKRIFKHFRLPLNQLNQKKDNKCVKIKIHLFENHFSNIVEYQTGLINNLTSDISFFNIHENAAKVLFRSKPLYSKVDGNFGNIHLVIIGFNKLAEQVILQAIRIAHYGIAKKPLITVLSANEKRMSWFLLRYKGIEKTCEINFKCINIKSKLLHEEIEKLNPKATYIVFCINNDEDAVLQALLASDKNIDLPMMISVSDNYYLSSLLNNDQNKFLNINIFNQTNAIANSKVILNEELDKLAIDIHHYYEKKYIMDNSESITNNHNNHHPKLQKWQNLSIFKKEDNRAQADHIDTKLCILGLKKIKSSELKHLTDHVIMDHEAYNQQISGELLEQAARSEHERWSTMHFLHGWEDSPSIAVKDISNKTHPCLVRWDNLDEVSRAHTRNNDRQINYKEYNYNIVRDLYELLTSNGYLLMKQHKN